MVESFHCPQAHVAVILTDEGHSKKEKFHKLSSTIVETPNTMENETIIQPSSWDVTFKLPHGHQVVYLSDITHPYHVREGTIRYVCDKIKETTQGPQVVWYQGSIIQAAGRAEHSSNGSTDIVIAPLSSGHDNAGVYLHINSSEDLSGCPIEVHLHSSLFLAFGQLFRFYGLWIVNVVLVATLLKLVCKDHKQIVMCILLLVTYGMLWETGLEALMQGLNERLSSIPYSIATSPAPRSSRVPTWWIRYAIAFLGLGISASLFAILHFLLFIFTSIYRFCFGRSQQKPKLVDSMLVLVILFSICWRRLPGLVVLAVSILRQLVICCHHITTQSDEAKRSHARLLLLTVAVGYLLGTGFSIAFHFKDNLGFLHNDVYSSHGHMIALWSLVGSGTHQLSCSLVQNVSHGLPPSVHASLELGIVLCLSAPILCFAGSGLSWAYGAWCILVYTLTSSILSFLKEFLSLLVTKPKAS